MHYLKISIAFSSWLSPSRLGRAFTQSLRRAIATCARAFRHRRRRSEQRSLSAERRRGVDFLGLMLGH